ncbi:MAG TPA: ABC transporter ATP-binding protein [Candidatus Acidoferrum sp.]|nr:ABC transporter ATP-binding protein [Candidatus Acidoferrum sp.]
MNRRMMSGDGSRPKNLKRTAGRLVGMIASDYKWQLFAVACCILVSAVSNVLGAMFIKTLIDDYITPLLTAESPDFSGLAAAVLRMAGIYAVGVTAALVYTRVMVAVAQGTLKKLRDRMFTHMQSLPIRYFDSHTVGEIMSRYTNDTDTLRQMIAQSLPQLLSTVVTVAVVFVGMCTNSLILTAFVVLSLFVMLKGVRKVGGRSVKYFGAQQREMGKLNGYIEEMMAGQKVVKVFSRERQTEAAFDELNEALRVDATEAAGMANILMPMMGNLNQIQFAITAMLGGAMAVSGFGGMTLGGIASFLQLNRSFSMPISQISQQASAIIMALAGAERIFGLLDEQPEADTGSVGIVKKDEGWFFQTPDGEVRLRGDVRFEDVDFGYLPGQAVLHDVSLYAKPGQKVAFVGATGAGKTTVTNLINRFYDIEKGKITYDGIDIADIKKADLRKTLGMVLQDVNLFTGTIADNIRVGKPTATGEEVKRAAKIAGADSFIRHMPEGYDTMVEEGGGTLSQGQRQLLSIARAAVCDPPVMILDEATSSVDTRTEAIIGRGMDALMEGRTVFVIAHRLSTVRDASVIMVLADGRIIERGDHDDLIKEGGVYYRLYTGAFELE